MKDGYPEEQELERIRTWSIDDPLGLMEFVKSLWAYVDAGYWTQYLMKDGTSQFQISTAGWSGNEEIIEVLQENVVFWMMYWQSSKRGGHYEFYVPSSPHRNEKSTSQGMAE
jgi:hypothetical protein